MNKQITSPKIFIFEEVICIRTVIFYRRIKNMIYWSGDWVWDSVDS